MGNAMEFPNVRYFHGGRLEITGDFPGDDWRYEDTLGWTTLHPAK